MNIGKVTKTFHGTYNIDRVRILAAGDDRYLEIRGWQVPSRWIKGPGELSASADGNSDRISIVSVSRPDVKNLYKTDLDAGWIGFTCFAKLTDEQLKNGRVKLVLARGGKAFLKEKTDLTALPTESDETISYSIDAVSMAGGLECVMGWTYCKAENTFLSERAKTSERLGSSNQEDSSTQSGTLPPAYEEVALSVLQDGVPIPATVRREFRRDLVLPGCPEEYRSGFSISYKKDYDHDYTLVLTAPFGGRVEIPSSEYSQKEVYSKVRAQRTASAEELEKEREYTFSYAPRISILVPVYRTDPQGLKEMLESVLAGTYTNWELCLADGSCDEDRRRKEILDHYRKKDARIKVKVLDSNLGISANTNAAYEMAEGEWIALLDHDDILEPDALWQAVKAMQDSGSIPDVIYTDEDKTDGRSFFEPNFKPDFSLDYLRSGNYFTHFLLFRRELLKKVEEPLNPDFDGAQDYDLVLRLTERTGKIVHIPKVEYHWRTGEDSTSANPDSKRYAFSAGLRALQAHLDRTGTGAKAIETDYPGHYRVHYPIKNPDETVSIIIPTHEHADTLKRCVDSILDRTDYPAYEIILIENGSKDPVTFAYYEELKKDKRAAGRLQILTWDQGFNYSALNNFGAAHAKGSLLLFLNNDTEMTDQNWLGELVSNFQRQENIGVVGVKLLYPDRTVQHAGVVLGIGGVAGSVFVRMDADSPGYQMRAISRQDLSAVTAACMMASRQAYEQAGGFETDLAVAWNDIDFCLKVGRAGFRVVYDPEVCLLHYESLSRGYEDESPEKMARFKRESDYMKEKWADFLQAGDPFYNPNLTLTRSDYSLKVD
ncbi:MAG: glycosyltransferase family 2 protein [Eubacterium sp.]|nr:glycosyltransferase family 2 protein [Eubacterium sp.]